MHYIGNAFSLNMLGEADDVRVRRLTFSDVIVGFHDAPRTSVVGHESTAVILAGLLGLAPGALRPAGAGPSWPRPTITLQGGDTILVGQYSGPRLPEGATSLPDGAVIVWFLVSVTADALPDIYPDEVREGEIHTPGF